MDTLHLLKNRKSITNFNKKDITANILADILNCARVTPTSTTDQNLKFVVIKNDATKAKMANLTDASYITRANVVIAVFNEDNPFNLEYASAATETLLIAANYHKIGTKWITAYNQPYTNQVHTLLNAPDEMNLMGIVALGYYDFSVPGFRRIPSLSEMVAYEKFK